MSWMEKLCEAYDSAIDADQSGEASPLIPVGFTRKEIKYHIILSAEGEFVSAEEWEAKTFATIPSSPKAESRTGDSGTPFPLADQLKYLVSEEGENPRFGKYMEQLSAWCERPEAPECLRRLKNYLEQGTLLADLTGRAHLKVKYYKDAGGKGEYGPDAKAFAIFSVESDLEDEQGDALWKRRDIRESWGAYLGAAGTENDPLCYVEGRRLPGIDSHPKVQGNAKLISAKDNEFPFQYKGRFAEDRSAANVSYDASIRAHNALSWLVSRQGFQKYGMTLVAWNINGCPVPVPVEDFPLEPFLETPKKKPDTFQAYARHLKTARAGYGNQLEKYGKSRRADEVVILGMEAATDGRMSITYYQEMKGGDYIDRLQEWYRTCCWNIWSWSDRAYQIATPTPRQIAEAVMGTDSVQTAEQDKRCEKAASKLMRQLHMRLLSCIANQSRLPEDMVRSAFRRAVSPQGFTTREGRWAENGWRNCLAVTCALIRKKQSEEGAPADLVLAVNSTDRDYLYGRLLATADFAEWDSVDRPKEYLSNAVRYMQRFVQRPFVTWPQIHAKLIPYLNRLGKKRRRYQTLMGQIELLFRTEDRRSAASLSFGFLQGYYCQRQALFQEEREAEAVPYRLPTGRSELYGCLLAVADLAEACGADPDRESMTNALGRMAACAAVPLGTWPRIHAKVIPYLEKLGSQAEGYSRLFRRIEGRFTPEDRSSDAPLDGAFLHGYYGMRQAVLTGSLEQEERPANTHYMPDTREAVYGRLLGLGNGLERWVMDVIQKIPEEEYRPSNALRFMETFGRRPASTWRYLRGKLRPYEKKLHLQAGLYTEELERLEAILTERQWDNDTPLKGSYLNEYYRTDIPSKKER